MSIGMVDLHKYVSNNMRTGLSLNTQLIGRNNDLSKLIDVLSNAPYVAIIGESGAGKTRLALELLKYYEDNLGYEAYYLNNLSNIIETLGNVIDESKKIILLVDDANKYKMLEELMEYFKYYSNDNIKVVFTIRNYLAGFFSSMEEVVTYIMPKMSNDDIKEAIRVNKGVTNPMWLDQIVKVANGNIRVAFLATEAAIKDENGFYSLLNQSDVLNNFYKDMIAEVDNSSIVIMSAGIIALFKYINLNQLFYISPILKSINISKNEFTDAVNVLISKEIVNNYQNVISINDQCFADNILNVTLVEKRYYSLSSIIISGYKYYKDKIINAINTLVWVYRSEKIDDLLHNEISYVYNFYENDTEMQHIIISDFAQIIESIAIMEFKNGIEKYTDNKDINWLLLTANNLSYGKYDNVICEGLLRLLKKTKKKDVVCKKIKDIFSINDNSIQLAFKPLVNFLKHAKNNVDILDDILSDMIIEFLKIRFDYSKWDGKKSVVFKTLMINDNTNGIIELRDICFDIIKKMNAKKSYYILQKIDYIYTDDMINIMKCDIKHIKEVISEVLSDNELINYVIGLRYEEYISKYNIDNPFIFDEIKFNYIRLIANKKIDGESLDDFNNRHINQIGSFVNSSSFDQLNACIELLYPVCYDFYGFDSEKFLNIVIQSINKEKIELLYNIVNSKDLKYNEYYLFEKLNEIYDKRESLSFIQSIENNNLRDSLLFFFFSKLVDADCYEFTNEFISWIKSKVDSNVKTVIGRNVLHLKTIAEAASINLNDLVKIVYDKRKYNEFISECYLEGIFYDVDEMHKLFDLDNNLIENVYVFLANGKKYFDYDGDILKYILSKDQSFYKKYIDSLLLNNKIDDQNISFILDGEICNDFMDYYFKKLLAQNYHYGSFQFEHILAKSYNSNFLDIWISNFIEKKKNNDNAIRLLFEHISYFPKTALKKYILKYLSINKNSTIVPLLFHGGVVSYSDAKVFYSNEIDFYNEIKNELVKWDVVQYVSAIDDLINGCKRRIKEDEIENITGHIDNGLLLELQNNDYRTEISIRDGLELFLKDSKFRELLTNDYAKYEDGSFITSNNEPVKFSEALDNRKVYTLVIKENQSYEYHLSNINTILSDDRFVGLTICQCFKKLFEEKNWDVNDFIDNTNCDRDRYYTIMHNKSGFLKRETILAILIGLKLSKTQRDYLLELNKTTLSRNDKNDLVYLYLLASKVNISTANDLLKEVNLPRIGSKK